MGFPRRAGVLLHVSSLPGEHGIGDLGPEAYRFVDRMRNAGLGIWQLLPLGPTAQGNSPYSSYSAFAGNPLLISLDRLLADGLLDEGDLAVEPTFDVKAVDYDRLNEWKPRLLRKASERFYLRDDGNEQQAFHHFCEAERWWLHDFAFFMALAKHYGTADWSTWDPGVIARDAQTLEQWSQKLASAIKHEEFIQFSFFKQWHALKQYANSHGIQILGDLPIFVAYESADVWATQSNFYLNQSGKRTVVAGVPPDYFSATGQLWGNPLYRWDEAERQGYQWWVQRLKHSLSMYDSVRIDHFRGFEAYWEVPGDAETAIGGRWVKGPGDGLFRAAQRQQVPMNIVAEDLGMISDEVHALRDSLAFPGMRVFQFGYDDHEGAYHRPENYPVHSVAYTGTHDNDTIMGWYQARLVRVQANHTPIEHDFLLSWLGTDRSDVHWHLIQLVLQSKANTAILPLQDILGLGSDSRMNIPGLPEGNWRWRCTSEQLASSWETPLRALIEQSGR